jgi:hypothetical protein
MKNIEKIEKATKKLENIVAEEGYENLIKAIMLCVMKGGFLAYKPTKKELEKLEQSYELYLENDISLLDESICEIIIPNYNKLF